VKAQLERSISMTLGLRKLIVVGLVGADNPAIAEMSRRLNAGDRAWKADRTFEREWTTFGEFLEAIDLSRAVIGYGAFANHRLQATRTSRAG
jgi:hypothetical protein